MGKTQCAMRFILRIQQIKAVFLLFLLNLKADALVFYYVFSDFISFDPKL